MKTALTGARTINNEGPKNGRNPFSNYTANLQHAFTDACCLFLYCQHPIFEAHFIDE